MRVGDSLVVLAEDYVVVNPLTCQGYTASHRLTLRSPRRGRHRGYPPEPLRGQMSLHSPYSRHRRRSLCYPPDIPSSHGIPPQISPIPSSPLPIGKFYLNLPNKTYTHPDDGNKTYPVPPGVPAEHPPRHLHSRHPPSALFIYSKAPGGG